MMVVVVWRIGPLHLSEFGTDSCWKPTETAATDASAAAATSTEWLSSPTPSTVLNVAQRSSPLVFILPFLIPSHESLIKSSQDWQSPQSARLSRWHDDLFGIATLSLQLFNPRFHLEQGNQFDNLPDAGDDNYEGSEYQTSKEQDLDGPILHGKRDLTGLLA